MGTLAADRHGSTSATTHASSFAAVVDLAKLAGRFELTREPDGVADDGRPCFVVAFRPQAVPQTYDSREEMVVNQLAGRFWLAKEDLAIVQSEGALTRPVKVAWVASVYRLSFALPHAGAPRCAGERRDRAGQLRARPRRPGAALSRPPAPDHDHDSLSLRVTSTHLANLR